MLKLKLIDLPIFILMTVMFMCALLHPDIDASSHIRYIHPNVERSFKLYLGYIYSHSKLMQSFIMSLIILYIMGRRRYLLSISKQQQEEEQQLMDQQQQVHHSKDTAIMSIAETIKHDYLRRQEMKTAQRLRAKHNWIPYHHIPWEGITWVSLFLINHMISYTRLCLIMQHFGATKWETMALHLGIQRMFLSDILKLLPNEVSRLMKGGEAGLEGGGESTSLSNYIIYEPNLLD